MKKLLALAMALVMLFAFAACSTTTDEETTTEVVLDDVVYNIGICQLVQHDALDAATLGFMDALTELLGDNVTFDEQNASGDSATCSTITNQFVADGVDLIMANATNAMLAAAASTADIPILGTSITDYSSALEIDDWTGSTGLNISGTSDLAPLDEQAQMIVDLMPDVEKVSILYCSAESNSKYQSDEITGYLEALGIEVEVYTFADTNDLSSVLYSAIDDCDALYVPTDNAVASNTELINNICLPAEIPVFCGEEATCSGCGVATLTIQYYDIGYATGLMAYEILVNGADVSTMEIEFAPEFTYKYNADICAELGIEVPDTYEAIEA
ncbi:MAG: ABC transporter substrate-binding protein [Clostridia bacterium]